MSYGIKFHYINSSVNYEKSVTIYVEQNFQIKKNTL